MPSDTSGQIADERRAAGRTSPEEPGRYLVLLHNDNYTPMDFVVAILRSVFRKTLEDATAIMLTVHHSGVGRCGVYTREVAEAKVGLVHNEARAAGFPLKCSMQRV